MRYKTKNKVASKEDVTFFFYTHTHKKKIGKSVDKMNIYIYTSMKQIIYGGQTFSLIFKIKILIFFKCFDVS